MLVHSYEDIPVEPAFSGNALPRWGKWATQIPISSRVLASLFVWHDNETKHFFDFQLYRVLRFCWVASIFSVHVGEIPRVFQPEILSEMPCC